VIIQNYRCPGLNGWNKVAALSSSSIELYIICKQ